MKIKVPLQKNKSKVIEVEVITTGARKPAAIAQPELKKLKLNSEPQHQYKEKENKIFE